MKSEKEQLEQVCLEVVKLAHNTIQGMGDFAVSKVHVLGKTDIVTKGDLAISEGWKNYFAKNNIPIAVYTEESRNIPFPKPNEARYLGIGDEIDGTGNFNRSRFVFPSCAIFTIFDNVKPKFQDALVTAVFEHNSGNLWYAVRDKGCYFNDKRVYVSETTELGKDTFVIVDKGPCPTPEFSMRLFNLEQKCWPKNVSSAGIHMAGVASGLTNGWDAFVGLIQKPEELASGYLLIKEAGGCVMTTEGKSIDNELFDWNSTYEIITSSTKSLGEAIRNEILSKEKAGELVKRLYSL
jgi:fructose-1,6-bisphosphatase/inositol monophosphatase family enzyme